MAANAGGDFVEGGKGSPNRAFNLMLTRRGQEDGHQVEIHVYDTHTYLFPAGDLTKPHLVGDFHLEQNAIKVRGVSGIRPSISPGIYTLKAAPESQGTAASSLKKRLARNRSTTKKKTQRKHKK